MKSNLPSTMTDNVAILIDRDGSNVQKELRDRFIRAGGLDILAQLIHDAKLPGHWKFRIVKQFVGSSHTNRVRVLAPNPNDYQIQLKVKPGNNTTAIQGKLMVDKARGLTVQEVYQRLARVIDQAQAETNVEELAKETDLETEDILMGLTAVQILTGRNRAWGDRHEFLRAISLELGHTDNTTPAAVLCSTLRDKSYLEEDGVVFRLTLAGQTLLQPDEQEPEPEEQAMVVETPTPKPTPSPTPMQPQQNGHHVSRLLDLPPAPPSTISISSNATPSAPAVDALAQLLAKQGDLQAVLKISQDIKTNRDKQAQLRAELTKLQNEEKQLVHKIQVDSLLQLAANLKELQAHV